MDHDRLKTARSDNKREKCPSAKCRSTGRAAESNWFLSWRTSQGLDTALGRVESSNMELMPSLVISIGKGRKSLFTARHHSGQHFEEHSWQTALISFFFLLCCNFPLH